MSEGVGSKSVMVGPWNNWCWRDGVLAPGPAAVFDLDGVLSDAANRQHFLQGTWQDWNSFFEACGDDPLIEDVASLLGVLDHGLQVVLLTARPLRVRPHTLDWLTRMKLRWDLLVMRDYGDYLAARAFKKRSVEELREFGFDLRVGFEDDRRNVDMFRAAGIPCVYIHSGYYD